jgi:DNA invertase Pin-like site-specific DNA recombinase
MEVESGKRNDRPQLAAALAACRLHRAQLVLAKLDRLARNVAFIANLMDGGVDFVACDMPHANRLTLHLMAAMAEYEREMISQRTKAALAVAKARGVRLGNPNGAVYLASFSKDAARKSVEARRSSATARNRSVLNILESMGHSASNAHATAIALNHAGITTARGGRWSATQVRRIRLCLADVDNSSF